MEKKKIQRIIGIVVIMALVVIVMPLLVTKNDFTIQEAAQIKAPPFPEEQQRVAENQPVPQQDLPVGVSTLEPVAASTPETVSHDPSILSATKSENPAPTVKAPPAVIVAAVINRRNVPTPDKVDLPRQNKNMSTPEQKDTDRTIQSVPPKKTTPSRHIKTVSHLPKKSTLAVSKSPSWAVQMGSFKVKQNALHLTNKLRAAGYKAFTKEFKSANGKSSTRVYIGPEVERSAALKLAEKAEHHFDLQGIVISYKPLEL